MLNNKFEFRHVLFKTVKELHYITLQMPKKVKSKKSKPTFTNNPLDLKTLCIINLTESDTQVLENYSKESMNLLKTDFWKDVHKHAYPIQKNISTYWFKK